MTIFAVDVGYHALSAVVAGIMFNNWEDSIPTSHSVIYVDDIAEYEPGYFYKRELPCILQILNQLNNLPEYIIVDGYVYLDQSQTPGLGKHLYDALEGRSIVIGVAKTRFKDMSPEVEVFRGKSQRPIYVTAAGISDIKAKCLIKKMDGRYRIPAMLKLVDQLTKKHSL